MSKSVKCDSYKDKSWRRCCDKCLDSFFECYICKDYFKSRHFFNHMNIHYNDPNLHISCITYNVNQHINGFRIKIFFNLDYVFVCIDIDINIPNIDSRNMSNNVT